MSLSLAAPCDRIAPIDGARIWAENDFGAVDPYRGPSPKPSETEYVRSYPVPRCR